MLVSTRELFLYIKRSLNQCCGVDTCDTLLQLSKAFDECLVLYAEGILKQVL